MEHETLSPRELETLTWADSETAQIIGVSYSSVHGYMNSLKSKIDVANVTHAVARGYELGILELRTAEPRVMMAATLSPAPIH
jgi:DNA-binding CsgD family transcriptional regulator